MNTEPTLTELADPVGDKTGVPETPPPAGHGRLWPTILIVGLLAGTATGWWYTRPHPLPTTLLGDEPSPLNLQGFDQPQALNGSCISSYQVNGTGTDAQGTQRYALSIQLVADPADEAALGQLMATDDCAGELKLIGETLTERLGLKAAQQELIATSYKTNRTYATEPGGLLPFSEKVRKS